MLTERIWERIKGRAQRDAAQHRRRLTPPEAEQVVNYIVVTEDGPFPQPVIGFYARELIRLTEEARSVD